MEFLARTAEELVDLPSDTDIYLYIAERLKDLLPDNPRYYIYSFNEDKGNFFWHAVENEKVRKGFTELIGFDPVGTVFPIKDFFYSAPFFEDAITFKDMRVMHFRPFYDKEEYSVYDACARQFPDEICEAILTKFNIAKIYLTGLMWQKQLFGMVGIGLSRDEKLENKQALLSFFRQASIALARRMTEQRLLRSEKKFEDIVTGMETPAMVLDKLGTIRLLNQRFRYKFGYDMADISSWDAWLDKAFPDADYRNKVEICINKNTVNQVKSQKEIFSITCGDNSVKSASIKTVPLSDGMKAILLESR